jgi:diadenosine tetraphosphate (Ap4A) HIT family hydrolase
MNRCAYCDKMAKNDLDNLILENRHAKALFEDYFREGHCTVVLKKHKISVSEINPDEYNSICELITKVSKALEKKYDCDKTYLLSIGDRVEHIHFHLIPKHKDKCSMGVYCFEKLFEVEGKRKTPASELHKSAAEIKSIIENP